MKFKKNVTLFFSFLFVLNTSAKQTNEDKITLSFQDLPISEAVNRIEDNTDYTFFYDAALIEVNQKVSLNAKDASLSDALSQMFAKSNIQFEFKKSQILLYPKDNNTKRENIVVRGNVTDPSGEPLIGVSVTIKDRPDIGTITDADGSYTLSVPGRSSILLFSYIGYATVEETIINRKIINVVMKEDVEQLGDVVVVGYGVQKKASVVAAITSVKPAQLNISASRSLSNDLAGNIGGIIAVQRSGEPGYDNSEFWIRGMSSFKGKNQPLVLVDGIERSLNNIDIAEIESFSVLKDASASAVYGVRGANGVILITTKRGHSGKTAINVSVEHSFTKPAKLPKFLNAPDYLTLLNNINIQETGSALYSDDVINKYRTGYDTELYPDVDWLDAITKDFAHNTRASFDLSGGSDKLRYSFVGAYYNESGITTSDKSQSWNSNISLDRFNLRTNVDMNVTPTTLVTLNIGGYLQNRRAPRDGINDIFDAAFKATPYMSPPIYQDGRLPKPRENENPWARLTQTGFKREAESKLETVFAVEQDLKAILPGLKAKGIFSFDSFSKNGVIRGKNPRYYAPATQRDPITGELALIVLSEGDEFLGYEKKPEYGSNSTYLEGNITYDQRFGDHTVSGLFLYNQRSYDDGDQVPYRNQGIAGRAAYTYLDRYIMEFNFGYNGSENFAKNKRFGFFPSIAAGWIMSEEPFMESLNNIFHKIKFRVSYGLVGNDRFYIDPDTQKRFAYITTIQNTGTDGGYKWGNSSSFYEKGGLREGDPGVPNLTWETVKKTNLGLELGLFNMIELQLDVFHERREDIFIQRKNYPTSAGFPSLPWANYGIVENKGLDVSIDVNKQINKDWFISARGSFTYAKNKIIEQDEDIGVLGTHRSSTGKPVGQLFGLLTDGLFTEDDFVNTSTGELKSDIPKHKYSDRVYPGDIKYVDLDGDGEITDKDKTAIGGTVNPELVYGFGLNVSYKNFDFGCFFQGNGNTYRIIGDGQKNFLPGSTIGAEGNIFRNASDAWTVDNQNPNAFYPRLHMGYNANNAQTSDWWLKEMSMIRLKNVELGYSLPRNFIKKAAMEHARIFVRGTNLFYFSDFKLWDPELDTNNGLKYPIMGTLSLGLQVRF